MDDSSEEDFNADDEFQASVNGKQMSSMSPG